MFRFNFFQLSGIVALIFWGCPTTSGQNDYDYLRSPLAFRVDTIPSTHLFCSQGDTPFLSVDSCVAAKKYALRWDRPEDTSGLFEYRIYLDTSSSSPARSGKTWSEVRKDRTLADAIILGTGNASDSLIFVFNNAGDPHPKEIPPGTPRILAFDTTGHINTQGRLVFAIVAAYRQTGTEGQPGYSWIITNDRFSPFPLQIRFVPYDRSVEIGWNRPPDRTSFFNPAADSGVIREYVLRVLRGGILNANRPGVFAPQLQFINGGIDWSSRVRVDTFTNSKGVQGLKFTLPDSQHVFNGQFSDPRDSLTAILIGLTPQDTVDLSLWAIDAANNSTDSTSVTRLILTDTTEPLPPRLRSIPGGTTRNQFVYAFTASRDLVEFNDSLIPADSPNANIREYHVFRRLISGSFGGNASHDTTLVVTGKNRRDTLFIDTVRYLPPGSVYRIFAQAMDSSGHLSLLDSLDDSTLAVSFPDQDSASTCPSGFVPIPAATFVLGDPSAAADADEKPAQKRSIGSYCIENYEHRDGSGVFQNRKTWQEADEICRNLSPSDGTHLCTESEWERACEGSDSIPLTYGFQSEDPNNPNSVFKVCNVGTGDSDMARIQSLRNPTCLTREGAFDLSGNFAEWVSDPYSQTAYSLPDTVLFPGQSLVSQADTAVHVIRGGNFLNAHLSTATKLRSARCSNRDYPTQIRPRPYAGCLDSSSPQIILTYNNASLPPRCLPIPDTVQGRTITTLSPARDSSKILFLIEGVATPITYALPFSSTYQPYRPIDARLTSRTLAVVTFENSLTGDALVDTLDATEMTDTSDAIMTAIFTREVSPPWSVRRENGRYAVRFLYAHAQLRNVPARRQYSNAVIGFRCCSLPRPAP